MEPNIIPIDGRLWVTSREIAEKFRKQHGHVLKKIRELECSEKFTESNFRLSEYEDATGRKVPQYLIARDGFSFLVMGFTYEDKIST